MLVDADNNFMTQRAFPKMATISVGLESSGLKIEAEGHDVLRVPFDAVPHLPLEVNVWDRRCIAMRISDAADEWFSDVLGIKCHLDYMADDSKRLVHPDSDQIVSFADGYPFLLATEASLADLNSRLAHSISMNRFRPNLVIGGAEPFAEDDWKSVWVGEVNFQVAKPCARCVMTTVDQERGVKSGDEPLRTLATFRRNGNEVIFGQNLIAAGEGQTLKVGDRFRIN